MNQTLMRFRPQSSATPLCTEPAPGIVAHPASSTKVCRFHSLSAASSLIFASEPIGLRASSSQIIARFATRAVFDIRAALVWVSQLKPKPSQLKPIALHATIVNSAVKIICGGDHRRLSFAKLLSRKVVCDAGESHSHPRPYICWRREASVGVGDDWPQIGAVVWFRVRTKSNFGAVPCACFGFLDTCARIHRAALICTIGQTPGISDFRTQSNYPQRVLDAASAPIQHEP